MDAALWGLIGTFVGALASIGTTWIAARNSAALQEHASKLDRDERMRAFQRETLLSIQDAMHDFLRLMTQIYLEDRSSFEKTGQWGRQRLSQEIDEGSRVANRRLSMLIERVADDALRSELRSLHGMANKLSGSRDGNYAESIYQKMGIDAEATMQQLGTTLRSLY